MNDNPRDTQFQGFAKLLSDELKVTGGYPISEVRMMIARRAYDLASHIARYINERDLVMVRSGMISEEDCVARLPDMEGWTYEGGTNQC